MSRLRHTSRLLLGFALVSAGTLACSTASGRTATSKMGLSAGFQPGAATLRQFVGEQLSQAKDETKHEIFKTEARRQLANLRPKATTDADRQVVLLLANLMSKDNQRLTLVFMTRNGTNYESVQPEITELYQGRLACDDELRGWLEYAQADRATLERGPCLAEARAAAAILGR